MRTYTGLRAMGTCSVKVADDGRDRDPPAEPRTYWLAHVETRLLNVRAHFEWGFYGPGPRHVALSLLADATGDDELAIQYFDRFYHTVAEFPRDDGFTITDQQISDWLTLAAGAELVGEFS